MTALMLRQRLLALRAYRLWLHTGHDPGWFYPVVDPDDARVYRDALRLFAQDVLGNHIPVV